MAEILSWRSCKKKIQKVEVVVKYAALLLNGFYSCINFTKRTFTESDLNAMGM